MTKKQEPQDFLPIRYSNMPQWLIIVLFGVRTLTSLGADFRVLVFAVLDVTLRNSVARPVSVVLQNG